MKRKSDIEKMLLEDIRDKKRTATGAFSKKGKGVKHGMRGVKFPYDYMKAKEKRLLNGKVQVSNMYETIITKDEFLLKDSETQKAMMLRWRELFPNPKIMSEMGIKSNSAFHKIINDLDLPRKNRHGGLRQTKKTVKKEVAAKEKEPAQLELIPTETTQIITNGLHLTWNGNYTCNELQKMFEKVGLLVDTEDAKKKYRLRFVIEEI